jgi:hypothetical protein
MESPWKIVTESQFLVIQLHIVFWIKQALPFIEIPGLGLKVLLALFDCEKNTDGTTRNRHEMKFFIRYGFVMGMFQRKYSHF